jgi:hypothetical protein
MTSLSHNRILTSDFSSEHNAIKNHSSYATPVAIVICPKMMKNEQELERKRLSC